MTREEEPRVNAEDDVLREIARLRSELSSLSLQITHTHASISRLEGAVSYEEGTPSPTTPFLTIDVEFVVGKRVTILSRNNEAWQTAQYVGRQARIKRVTPKCLWLSIPGRAELLRRNKEYVQLIN